MTSRRRDRERRQARRPPFRDPRPVILVVCEGKKTEPQYLTGFWKAARNPRVRISVRPEGGVPMTLVEATKQAKEEAEREARKEDDENLAFDATWCVFDVDAHPNLPAARQMARDNGIDLAISNPCFELWLLLHFRDNPGMQDRHKMKELLTGYVPEYDKHVEFKTYSAGYPQAVKRARQLDEAADSAGDSGRNPTTGVYRLTELICAEARQDLRQE
jgi:hypothetical protein